MNALDVSVRTPASVTAWITVDPARLPRAYQYVLYALAFALILFVRRPDQFVHPQVWVEDGQQILPGLVNVGPSSILEPVNGYLIVVSKIIAFIALSISISEYPLISTLLAWAFATATLFAVSVSPIVLRGGFLLALAVALVPSDPEVFDLPSYAFWWAGLLVVLAALWRRHAAGTPWRVAFAAVGSISSPLILLVLPMLVFRAIVWRKDVVERVVAGVAVAGGAIQVRQMLLVHISPESSLSIGTVLTVLRSFFGNYLVGSLARALPALAPGLEWTAALATLALVIAALRTGRRDLVVLALPLYLMCGSMALSAARVPAAVIDPVSAGPRYFFFPFAFEAWLLLQIAFVGGAYLRATAAAFLSIAVLNALPVLTRSHVDLRWMANLAACDEAGDADLYKIPVQYDGRLESEWNLPLTGAQCRLLRARDLLAWTMPSHPPPVLAYTMHELFPGVKWPASIAPAGNVVSDGWNGTDYGRSSLPGFEVIGSYRSSDQDTGRLALRLSRGDLVAYRSGPVVDQQRISIEGQPPGRFDTALPLAPGWSILEFADPRLPKQFTVTFEDAGTGWGEWSAVALTN